MTSSFVIFIIPIELRLLSVHQTGPISSLTGERHKPPPPPPSPDYRDEELTIRIGNRIKNLLYSGTATISNNSSSSKRVEWIFWMRLQPAPAP